MSYVPELGRFRPLSRSDFSLRAKHTAWLLDTPLQATQEWLARAYGYGNLHELQRDLDAAAKSPATHPPGPFDEALYATLGTKSSGDGLGDVTHLIPDFRRNRLVQALATLPHPSIHLEGARRHHKIADIGLFCEPQGHRVAFQQVRELFQALEPPPNANQPRDLASDYAYLSDDGEHGAMLCFTKLGRAVYDAVQEICESSPDSEALAHRFSQLQRKYPSNPWAHACAVCELAPAYWQSAWADNLPQSAEGMDPGDANPSYRLNARALALKLEPTARLAIDLFEELYGDAKHRAADHRLSSAIGEYGSDSFAYPAILYWGGRVAMNAGDFDTARKRLRQNMRIVKGENFGSRYPLSALNLHAGRGPTAALWGSTSKRSEYADVWMNLVEMSEAFTKNETTTAFDAFGRALFRSAHVLRAIVPNFRAADACRVGSNHHHVAHLQEFFYRTETFWKRHAREWLMLERVCAHPNLQQSYVAHHRSTSDSWGSAFKSNEENVRLASLRRNASAAFAQQYREAVASVTGVPYSHDIAAGSGPL
jgi:hypothetical protein